MPINAYTKAQILAQALPYIRRFAGRTIVVKYGGNAMTEEALKNSFAQDIVLLKLVGLNPIVVHGGGPQIDTMLKKVGKTGKFIQGMRVTDSETMAIVEMVLGGQVNKNIVSLLNVHGGKAIGLTGRDNHFIRAKKHKTHTLDGQCLDLGQVGEVAHIDCTFIEQISQAGYIPVIAPIGVDEQGNAYNINADLVAGYLAQALHAEKLILMTNITGVLDKNGQLLTQLTPTHIQTLINDGTLSGGMLPKLASALSAAQNGVKAVHIIDGRIPNVLLLEIFTDEGIGTMILGEQAHN